MAYAKQTWANGEAGATPLSAARLNHIEDGIDAVDTALEAKQDAGDYATNAALTSGLAGKANSSHTHTIANVTDLQAALDGKQASGDYATGTELTDGLATKANSSHSHAAADVNSGTFDAARIPNLAASKITSGTLAAAQIPTLAQSKITNLATDLAARPTSTDVTSIAVGDELPGTVVNGQLFFVIAP